MSFLSKVELKKQLRDMGINVEGNYVRKKDIESTIAITMTEAATSDKKRLLECGYDVECLGKLQRYLKSLMEKEFKNSISEDMDDWLVEMYNDIVKYKTDRINAFNKLQTKGTNVTKMPISPIPAKE